MSDNHVVLIPVDPHFAPRPASAEKARLILAKALPRADEVAARLGAAPELVHPGGNWSGVRCALCRAELDDDWWGAAVGVAADGDFADLRVTTPCCGGATSLNDLDYVWPAGFGRFVLDARNPGVAKLSRKLVRELQDVVGSELRTIWQHV